MKNTFKIYAIIWAVAFAIFNLVTLYPAISAGAEITSSFVFSYVFCLLAFVEQLGCGFFAFKESNLQKVFYNIPIITTSYSALIVMTIASVVLSVLNVPNFVVSAVCAVIALFSVVAVLKADFVGEAVSKIDEKIKEQTFFIKNLTVDAEILVSKASTDGAKSEAKKVFDAIRYSDPKSNPALYQLENEISNKFNAFKYAVEIGNVAEIKADELLVLIEERNKKCKILK